MTTNSTTGRRTLALALVVLLLGLVALLTRVEGIAVVPVPPRVSVSKDKNLVLLKDGWRRIDSDKQFEKGLPHPVVGDKHLRPDGTIVVLIAALRETRLKDTLVSLFSQARHPERIYVAVVQQNAPEDEDILVEYCREMGKPITLDPETMLPVGNHDCPYVNQIRVKRMLAKEARGPAYARALGHYLVDFEKDDFCMQIDAHTKVLKDWDLLILEDWAKTNNEYAILTTYPTNVNDLGKNTGGHWEMPHLCCAHGTRGVLVNCQAKAAANLEAPLLAPLWAAGLSFSKCHAEKAAPNDINFKGVFAGEEYARGVRLWTHGYDFYSVSRPYLSTYYGHEKGGKSSHWKTDSLREAEKRMSTLVRSPGYDSEEEIRALEPYGLGDKRTLDQYIEFTGIDPRSGKSTPICAVIYYPWLLPTVSPTPAVAGSLRKATPGEPVSFDSAWEQSFLMNPGMRGIIILVIILFTLAIFGLCLVISRSRALRKRLRKD